MNLFDGWTFDIITYMKFNNIDDQTMITLVTTLVTKDAKEFYTKYVTRKPHRWTISKFIPALSNYCFPPNIIDQLRRRWENVSQGK